MRRAERRRLPWRSWISDIGEGWVGRCERVGGSEGEQDTEGEVMEAEAEGKVMEVEAEGTME